MLPTDTDDPFVVLVRNMEGDGRGHLLFHKGQALLHRLVRVSVDVDIEVVLAKVLKHDLHIA